MSRGALSEKPRYAQVAQALIEDIEAGSYPVGGLLPTEQKLCTQFDISRHTAREAIRRLQALGLVTRKPGVGTRVRADQVEQRYVQVGDSVSSLYEYARDVTFSLGNREDIAAEGEIAALLGSAFGKVWTRVQGLRARQAAEPPIAMTDIYIARSFRGISEGIEAAHSPVWSLIERRYGVSPAEVRQQIGAVVLDDTQAELLHASPGDPALRITRHYATGAGETYLVAVNLYPADRFTYANTLRLEAPASPRRSE